MIAASALVKGKEYQIVSLPQERNQRLLEIGLTEGETIQLLHKAPFNGPICLSVDRQRIALRVDEAKLIMCQLKSDDK